MEAFSDMLQEHKLPHTVWLLGVRYTLAHQPGSAAGNEEARPVIDESQKFKMDMWSRMWFSYRYNFHPIAGTELTTDTGWGCMIRSGQMMIAQALVHHHLGRDWRLLHTSKYNELPSDYRKVLEMFLDHPCAPLSIHSFVRAGQQVGKKAGTWFGPNTVCSAFSKLHAGGALGSDSSLQLLAYDGNDGDNTIYTSEARELLQAGPLFILLPTRLGVSAVDASYIPKVAHVFSFPQSLGFIGGKPSSAHYFIASQGEAVYYLDPHTPQPIINISDKDHRSFHSSAAHRMLLQHVDPSLTFGFYVKDEADLSDLCDRLTTMNQALGGYPAISVAEKKSVPAADLNFDETEDDDGVILI